MALVNKTRGAEHVLEVADAKSKAWSENTLDFSQSKIEGIRDGQPRPGDHVTDILFMPPKGAELLIDDVLLFEPGED